MKQITRIFSANPAAVLAGLLLVPAGLHAAQMAYEGFAYPAPGTGTLTGQSGGAGWAAAWQTVNNGSADLVTGSLAGGAAVPSGFDALSNGNSSYLPTNRRVGRFLDTSVGGPFEAHGYRDGNGRIGMDDKTIYISFLQQPNGTTSYYEFEFHRGDLGDNGRIAGIGNDQGTSTNVFLRAPNATHTSFGTGSTTVNFYVVRIDFKAGLDDVYVYRNPTSPTEPGTPTLTKLAVADMSFDGISFGAFNNSRTVAHDEVRIGETWADVTSPPAAPTFVSQPHAASNFAGGAVVLTAAATGSPLPAYQWYKGATLLTGQTNAKLTLTNVQAADAADYTVTATNTVNTATSNVAHVTVVATPPGLLAYEGFDYAVGTRSVLAQTGGLGWGAAWTNVNGIGGNIVPGSLVTGTNSPNGYDAMSIGNSHFMPNSQRDGRMFDTSPTGRLAAAGYLDANNRIGADGKTLYLSFIQQPSGTTAFYEFELHKDNLGDPGRIGGIGNDSGTNVNLRTGATQTLIGPGNTGVNFYVVRIDYKAGNDDVYVYQNPISSTEPGTPTLTKLAAADMSFNGISLAAYLNGRTVMHDEIRLGAAWSDVVFGTSRQLNWAGDGIANNWDDSTLNWKSNGTSVTYNDDTPVSFDDTGSATPAVNIATTVAPALISFDNTTKNYTLGGGGSISGSGGLSKSGSGSVTLNCPLSFSASMVVNAGALNLNPGTTALGGGGYYVGDFIVKGGAVSVTGDNYFAGNLLGTGGGVTLDGDNTFTGRFYAFGTDLTLNGVNNFYGGFDPSGGTQTLGGTNSFNEFVNVNGAATTLTGTTTVTGTGSGYVFVGNGPASSSLTVQAGASLTMTGSFADNWVIGRDGGSGTVTQNGGTITYNPTNRSVAYLGASTSALTSSIYNMNGGTLEMSTKSLYVAMGPITCHLNQSGGVINLNELRLGLTLPQGIGTGLFDLTGGVMNVGASGLTSGNGHYTINLGAGTLAAAASWSSPLNMVLTGTGGDVSFDTGANAISLSGGLSGAGGLHKMGDGTLFLTGSNSYAGVTTVNVGTLAGSGIGDYSTLTVASGASVAPGVAGIGTFYCDAATFAAGSALVLDIDSATSSADSLVARAAINITGSTVAFTEIGTGAIAPGTTLVLLDSLNATLTGTFAGHPDGSLVTVGANAFTLHYSGTQVTLTANAAGTPYSNWATAKGLDGSPGKDPAFDADPEHDGIANGLEWILGGDPLAQDASALVTATGSAVGGLTLTFTRQETSLGNATLVAQWDTDLDGTWTDVPIEQAGGSYGDVTVTVNEAATPDAVIVHIPAANAANGRLLGRLRATMP